MLINIRHSYFKPVFCVVSFSDIAIRKEEETIGLKTFKENESQRSLQSGLLEVPVYRFCLFISGFDKLFNINCLEV